MYIITSNYFARHTAVHKMIVKFHIQYWMKMRYVVTRAYGMTKGGEEMNRGRKQGGVGGTHKRVGTRWGWIKEVIFAGTQAVIINETDGALAALYFVALELDFLIFGEDDVKLSGSISLHKISTFIRTHFSFRVSVGIIYHRGCSIVLT